MESWWVKFGDGALTLSRTQRVTGACLWQQCRSRTCWEVRLMREDPSCAFLTPA